MNLFLESTLWMLGGAGIAVTAAMFGSAVLRLAGYPAENRAERGAIAFALGAALLGCAIWILGLAGQLRASWAVVVLILMALAGWRLGGGLREQAGPVFRKFGTGWASLGLFEKITVVMIALSAVTTLWGAGTLQLGRDALAYHFLCPKEFVRAGVMEPIRYNVNALQPLLTQMLYALGLLFHSEILGKFLNFGFFILTAGAVSAFTLRLTGERVSALAAFGLMILSPGWAVQSTYAYADTAQSFFLICAFIALWDFTKEFRAASLIIGSFLLGAAASVKMLAIPAAALFAFFTAWQLLASGRGAFWKLRMMGIGLFFLLLPSLGWYLRAYLVTGNPVFPYFNEFFTGNAWASGVRDSVGIGRGLWQFAAAPFLVFLDPEPFGGGASQLGPVWLLTAPLWLRSSIRPADRNKLLGVAVLLYLMWFFLAQNQRFLFPVLPFLAVLGGASLGRLSRDRGVLPAIMKGLVTLACVLQLGLIFYYNGKTARYYLYPSKLAYLEANERSYRASAWINQHLPQDAYLFVAGEPELYYLDRRTVREEVWARYRPEVPPQAGAILTELQREGFSHYLVRRDEAKKGRPRQSYVDLFLKDTAARGGIQLIHREHFQFDGQRGFYELYAILKPADRASADNTMKPGVFLGPKS
jgi:hypothetical protein